MRPPDQIPDTASAVMKPNDAVYLWHNRHYSRWTLKAVHDYQDAITVENGIGQMIVRRAEIITEHGYLEEKLKDDTEAARERYKEIIHHWERGLRKSKEIGSLIGQSARATGQMIAAAKRWGLIVPDKEPDAEPPVD